ncbi:MAG: 50S ribosomal protein L22 [Planctomycetota bacterium]|nr:MAG: 50S ribosomal protein L22 [Planctomycetota bacterium]
MEFRAIHRYAHISASKARPAADLIRGQDANSALLLLRGHPSRGAAFFRKVLESAIANAGQNEAVDVNTLRVADARVDGGPLVHGRQRFRSGTMGRAMPIRRRTAHLAVVLAEGGAPEPGKEKGK